MNRKLIIAVVLVAALALSSDAFLMEKKLAKYFLLGVALAPRGFVPVPIPQYKYGHKEKVEHVHVHGHHGHHEHHDDHHHGWH